MNVIKQLDVQHSLVKHECDPTHAYMYACVCPREVPLIPKSAHIIPKLGVDSSPLMLLN
jgi:hypothetical protein